ncbi:MAG: RNase adapter RapZ [Gammaproteobacteria bacterium]
MRLIVVSGLSGSGKSVALNKLEDMDFFCIDNVPAALLNTLIAQILETDDNLYENIAVGVDARNRLADLESLPDLLHTLSKQGVDCETIFLHADTPILLKRYRETRRKHPLIEKGMSLRDAISRERELLEPMSYSADLVIDTTGTSIYEIGELIKQRIGRRTAPDLSILIESFGFKHGIPHDADFVFDVRCLPNPYWEAALRPLNGKDASVIAFLQKHDIVNSMCADIVKFLDNRIAEYIAGERYYLTIAVGCTGGQHRSVYMVEQLVADLSKKYDHILSRHNEIPIPDVQAV